MIKSFDLSCFYDFPDKDQPNIYDVRLFQIYGIVGDYLSDFGDPCKIRVSPHRFLTVRIFPGLFSVSFWAKNGHNTIKSGFHSVAELKREKTGYVFDAWEFLLSNEIMVEPLRVGDWQYVKANIQDFAGEIINTTNCGLMNYDYILDDDELDVSAFYSPERFAICGHEIQGISVAFPAQFDAHGISYCLNQALRSPIDFTEDDWLDFLEMLKDIQVVAVQIYSTNCSIVVDPYARIHINTKTFYKELTPRSMDDALKLILKVLDAARNGSLENFVNKAKLLGM